MITAFKGFLSSNREKELEAENSRLSKELRDVNKRLTLANETITEIRSHRPMNDQEWAMFQNQTQTIADQQEQLNQLAVWLRQNKKKEIDAGLHTRGLIPTILMYLGQASQEVNIPVKVVKDEGTGGAAN